MSRFLDRLADPAPLLFDGGFGSQLFARGVKLANSALANQSHPQDVQAVHAAYIEAGADAIETNTFVASPLHLDMAGKGPEDAAPLCRRAAEIARRAAEEAGRPVYVGGSVGPSPGAIEADGGTDFGIAETKVRDAHARVVEALAEAGVDFLCIETMFSAKEAAIAVDIARRTGLPIAVNMTYKCTRNRRTGEIVYKTDWGHSPADLIEFLAGGEFSSGENLLPHVHLLGLNCGAETRDEGHTGMPYAIEGLRQLRQTLAERKVEGKRLMAYPNAGLPTLNKEQETVYAQSPEDMAALLPDLLAQDAFLVGGCCGTGPEHIRAFRRVLDARS